MRSAAAAALLMIASLAVYAPRLAEAPIYLTHDEVVFALNAKSIAKTGRGLDGRLLPLYFEIVPGYWAQPIVVYVTAIALRVAPLTESAIRAPSVLVGTLSIVLMYVVARRLFRSAGFAAVAAALLAFTPAHFIHSRMGVDPIYPELFVIAALWCAAAYDEEPRRWLIALEGLILGVGLYSYIGSIVMMPVFFVLTLTLIVARHRDPMRSSAAGLAAFFTAALPLVLWLVAHPGVYAEQMHRYSVYDSSRFNALQGLREIFSYEGLSARTSAYWSYFSPSFLFFAGGTSLVNSTRRAGVFVLAMAVLIPLGIYRILQPGRTRMDVLLLAGFAASPTAAALVAGDFAMDRVVVMLPFAVLIATIAVRNLWEARGLSARAALTVVLTLTAVQFFAFRRDYFTDYRVRSSIWFERNLRGALEEILARDASDGVPAVYLSRAIPWVDAYWQFYAAKHGREDILTRTVYTNTDRLIAEAIAPRSLVLVEAHKPDTGNPSALRRVAVVKEPDGSPSFALFER